MTMPEQPDPPAPDTPEDYMAARALAGRIADFSTEEAVERFGVLPKLNAEALREVYFQLDHVTTRASNAGLIVRGADIEGELDLAGASGLGGAALPTLALEACVIRQRMTLRNAHIYMLSLEDSQFASMDGDGLWIDSDFHFDGLRPIGFTDAVFDNEAEAIEATKTELEAGPEAYLIVRGGRIGGNVYGRNARLRGEKFDPDHKRSDRHKRQWRYALRLTECRIGGSLYLSDGQRGIYAHGGIVIRNSTIGGNIVASGAHVVASDAYAFSIQDSDIGGEVQLLDGFNATGCVCLRQAHITGSVRFDGAHLRAWPDLPAKVRREEKVVNPGISRAVDAERVVLTGDMTFGTPEDYRPTHVRGNISLRGATIQGDLSWSALTIQPCPEGNAEYDRRADSTRPSLFRRRFPRANAAFFNLEAAQIQRRLRAHHLVNTGPLIIRMRDASAALLRDTWNAQDAEDLWSSRDETTVDEAAPEEITAWGDQGVYLQMDGFTYALPSVRQMERKKPRVKFDRWHDVFRIDKFVHWLLIQIATLYIMFREVVLADYVGPSVERLSWIRKGHPDRRSIFGFRLWRIIDRNSFRSQPYSQAALALNDVGLAADARRLLRRQQTLIRKVGPLIQRPHRWLHDIMFGYNLSPVRALVTLTVAFLIGWFGVWRANTGGMLELDVVPTERIDDGQPAAPAAYYDRTPVPCGGEINNALYALDVFVPLVDLHQVTECEIPSERIALATLAEADGQSSATVNACRAIDVAEGKTEFPGAGEMAVLARANQADCAVTWWRPPDAAQRLGAPDRIRMSRSLEPVALGPLRFEIDQPNFWRTAQAVYAMSGWVLLSLTILTFTGVMRRTGA